MNVSRRGFLIGAVAVPAGVVLPSALAAELALPAPEPKPGERVIVYGKMPQARRINIIDLNDAYFGNTEVLLMQDGVIFGTYILTAMQNRIEYEHLTSIGNSNAYMPRGPTHIDISMVRIA
jgi:hypothetical protein